MNRISPPKASSVRSSYEADAPAQPTKKSKALGFAVSLLKKISLRMPRKLSQLKAKLSFRRKKIARGSARLSPEAQDEEPEYPKAQFMTPLVLPGGKNTGPAKALHLQINARNLSDKSDAKPVTTKTAPVENSGEYCAQEASFENTEEKPASLLHSPKVNHTSVAAAKQQHQYTRRNQKATPKKQALSCPGLKKSDAAVVALFESITVNDLLEMRQKDNDLSSVSTKEIERLTARKLARNTAMTTFKRGAKGSSLCGAAVGFLSTFFPPLWGVALVGTSVGFMATGIACLIKYYRIKTRAHRTLSIISASTDPQTAQIREVLQKKVAMLDQQMGHLRERNAVTSIKERKAFEKVDNAFSGIGVLSTAFWRFSVLAPVLKTVAVGFDIAFAAVSTAFMATMNYVTRQKKLKTLGSMLDQSIVPDFMQRRLFFPLGDIVPCFIQSRLPFAKKSPYELYVQSNAKQIALAMGMEAGSPPKVIIEQLASPRWRTLAESVQWQCKRRVLLKEFSIFCATSHERLLACSDTAFELRYGKEFNHFLAEKIGGAAFNDTRHAGVRGTMNLTIPATVTCLFFGVLAPAIPFLLLGAGVSLCTCYAVAKREEKKFQISALEALNSARADDGQLLQQRETLKQLLLRKT
ncbi:hypothetical protein [Candidatus Sororendozoicomonas aggregata]|uniref:hypothetical protein n=1 Tax=Candidatus Sororendozoicomonas aggregata TaxID=3073239 RepID=UPI002ED30741